MFDPDAGKSIEEIIQRVWEEEWTAEKKARVLAIAEATGQTWFDVVCDGMERTLEMAKDPILGQRFKADWEFRRAPFGKDPFV